MEYVPPTNSGSVQQLIVRRWVPLFGMNSNIKRKCCAFIWMLRKKERKTLSSFKPMKWYKFSETQERSTWFWNWSRSDNVINALHAYDLITILRFFITNGSLKILVYVHIVFYFACLLNNSCHKLLNGWLAHGVTQKSLPTVTP